MLEAWDGLAEKCALPVSAAILDRKGTIVAVNAAWKEAGKRHGLRLANSGIGANYLNYCEGSEGSTLSRELGRLLAGKAKVLSRVYPCHSAEGRRWFFLLGLPLSAQSTAGVALMHLDISALLRPLGDEAVAAIDLDVLAKSLKSSSQAALSVQVADMLSKCSRAAAPRKSDEAKQILDLAGLSRRQLQILGLLGEGKTNAEIAKTLARSPNTIKLHVSAILRQLNLKSRTQAALLSVAHLNSDAKGDSRRGDRARRR